MTKHLTDKRVRFNLHPFKDSPNMTEAFRMAATLHKWSRTDIELVMNQVKGLELSKKFEILLSYCLTYPEEITSMHQSDVVYMLDFLGQHVHYLKSKPLAEWDDYDASNYQSIRRKATARIRRVYAHFDETVSEEDKYLVDSPPTKFYDTLEEALEAVPVGQESITNIYSVWIKES